MFRHLRRVAFRQKLAVRHRASVQVRDHTRNALIELALVVAKVGLSLCVLVDGDKRRGVWGRRGPSASVIPVRYGHVGYESVEVFR